MRVIIIGSGIAGLSAAIALRKIGAEVAVYERAPELREVGAGISLWANALRALDHLGAGDSVRAVSLRMVRSEVRGRSGRKVQLGTRADDLERTFGVPEFVRMIHRADLVSALAAHVPPGAARYGQECVAVEGGGAGAKVRFATGHSDEADVVIGADGIHSVVRTAILGPEAPRFAGYTCWRGICPRPEGVEPGYVGEWWGRGKRVGITTLPGDRVYWWATKNAPPNGHEADERAFLASEFRDWAEPAPALFATTPPDRIFRNDIIDRPPVRVWSKGRVGVIGDAAHPTTPNFGQGGCMALEDAVALARCLATAPDPARGLEAFAAERYPRTTAITRESRRFGALGQREGRLLCWVRDLAVGALAPLVATKGFLKYARFDVGPLPAPATA
ncbi:FAD-dependent monooxygenase [Gemmata sp. G18]|uniref:FAD-dependent monooxygenase n=1 Tax=Gemmata palustris TaxID=2822762 RepID=A0ABS5BT45_9BACT|nr:FAD-dependent monooxygenase [Gemmata palustris]MBP3956835.1 FAD-dependent monooxygenase [Gemmata palustris]